MPKGVYAQAGYFPNRFARRNQAVRKIPQIEPVFGPQEREAVLEVMDSGFVSEGRKTREFEAAIAKFLGVPHAIAVNNATIALTIALLGLGVGAGDEVIVPDFTFIATANAVSLTGATLVFADISLETFTLDLADAERRITPRTKAIIPVHLNGRAPGMERLMQLASAHHLAVVEDAAQALGSAQRGKFFGTFGDAGVFSLGATKIITSGQGGIVVTHRKELYEAFARIKDHGRASRSAEVHEIFGFNSKFTDLQAAMGLAQFRKLAERMAQKRRLFEWYRELLDGVEAVEVPPMNLREEVPWFVDVLCADRAALENHLRAAGIETRRFYRPVHAQPCYARPGSFPNTERIAHCGLWLPSSITLSRSDVEFICSEIAALRPARAVRAVQHTPAD
jgi:perosamine synthetase